MSKKTLAEFAWQVTPKRCKLLLALYEESPKRFTAFLVSFLRWFEDGAKRDAIEAATPDTLKPFEKADFQNACNEHLDKFRDYHDGAENPKTRTTATPQSKTDNRPTREQIDKICRDNADGSRDPEIYAERVWDEFIHTDWCDRNGKPITNFEAYIVKGLFPIIDKTLSETATGDDAFCGIRVG
jgi:hypothetical protein